MIPSALAQPPFLDSLVFRVLGKPENFESLVNDTFFLLQVYKYM